MWCKLGSISYMLHHYKTKMKYNVAIQNTDNMIWNTREESKNTSSVWSQFHSAHAHGLPLSLICILLFIDVLLCCILLWICFLLFVVALLCCILLWISFLLFIVTLLCCILLWICFVLFLVTLLICILLWICFLLFIVTLLFCILASVPYCSSLTSLYSVTWPGSSIELYLIVHCCFASLYSCIILACRSMKLDKPNESYP